MNGQVLPRPVDLNIYIDLIPLPGRINRPTWTGLSLEQKADQNNQKPGSVNPMTWKVTPRLTIDQKDDLANIQMPGQVYMRRPACLTNACVSCPYNHGDGRC